MEGKRCRDNVWGRNRSQVPCSQREERESKRERGLPGDHTRKTLPQGLWLGTQERLICMSFYNKQSSKTQVLKVYCMTGMECPNGTAVFLWRGKADSLEVDGVIWGSSVMHQERWFHPSSWSASGRHGIASLRTKELVGVISFPCPSAKAQRHLLRVPNSNTSALLYFPPNSMPCDLV